MSQFYPPLSKRRQLGATPCTAYDADRAMHLIAKHRSPLSIARLQTLLETPNPITTVSQSKSRIVKRNMGLILASI